MIDCVLDIERNTMDNKYFRHVVCTKEHQQLVLMSLKPNEEIGGEIHEDSDQFIRIEKGIGILELNGNMYSIRDGIAFIVPRGSFHNVINTSDNEYMKLYTIYSPPHHKPNKIDIEKPQDE